MAAKPLLLRCKTKNGHHLLDSLTAENTVEDLKGILFSLTGTNPDCLKVLAGYPPKLLDLTNDKMKLDDLLVQPKETLIVEEIDDICDNRKPNSQLILGNTIPDNNVPGGVLLRRIVPSNNSCLFTGIYFCLSAGEYNESVGPGLRQIIADTVASDKDKYNEGFLGKPNREYCTWILNEDNWGGSIEIYILSRYYNIEIVAVDTQTTRLYRFGEDMNYSQRILLIYDGIHYDPLMMEPLDNSKPIQTVFKTSHTPILDMALQVAREAKLSRQYTDVNNFALRCLVCNTGLRGQRQAQLHAKETGHINFGEI